MWVSVAALALLLAPSAPSFGEDADPLLTGLSENARKIVLESNAMHGGNYQGLCGYVTRDLNIAVNKGFESLQAKGEIEGPLGFYALESINYYQKRCRITN